MGSTGRTGGATVRSHCHDRRLIPIGSTELELEVKEGAKEGTQEGDEFIEFPHSSSEDYLIVMQECSQLLGSDFSVTSPKIPGVS